MLSSCHGDSCTQFLPVTFYFKLQKLPPVKICAAIPEQDSLLLAPPSHFLDCFWYF